MNVIVEVIVHLDDYHDSYRHTAETRDEAIQKAQAVWTAYSESGATITITQHSTGHITVRVEN